MSKEQELAARQRLKDDYEFYARNALFIRPKDGRLIPFEMNTGQKYIHSIVEDQRKRTGKVRVLILKGRQMGCTTYIQGRYFWRITHNIGMRAFILTHEEEATNNLFDMAKRYYENCPLNLRPTTKTSNAKELLFDKLDSGYKLGTAGNKSVGRSSTIQFLHASEAAFYKHAEEHAKGIMQTVPDANNTEIFLESTANGVGNWFHQQWQQAESGQSDYIPIFVPWFWQEEYRKECPLGFKPDEEEIELKQIFNITNEQLAWRRMKISELSVTGQDGKKSFRQEYPCIVGSQRVGTDHGILPIKDIISNFETSTGKINKQWCSGLKETIAIETTLGYRLECTLDHRIASHGNSFTEAKDSLGVLIKLNPPRFSNKIYSAEWNRLPCLKCSTLIDEDFALFLGFFMGDGSFHDNTLSIVFNKNDKSSIETVRELFIKLFDRIPQERITSPNGYEMRISIKSVKRMFIELGFITENDISTKRKVGVPECIWKSPKHIVKEFLKGLFDADGFAGKEQCDVKFFSKHTKFAKDVQLLLLGFGITCRRSSREKTAPNGTKYFGDEIYLRASEAREFVKQIGFVSDKKILRTNAWLLPNNHGRRSAPIEFIDTVKSINSLGKQLVYDLEMINEPHVFDAQGILVHNCTATEAFVLTGEDNYIPTELVLKARKAENVEKYGPLVIGVDPARFGDDRSAIIRRQGRHAYGLETYIKKDTMEIVGIVHNIINSEKPKAVCVDIGGLGAGIVDRLWELGHKDVVFGINSGSKPFEAKKFANKRAEMWCEGKQWLEDEPCKLPDSDELHADICNSKYKVDSNSRLIIEKKEDMKKRGVRSSDCADAWLLTFAMPQSFFDASSKSKADDRVKSAMSTFSKSQKLKKGRSAA